MSQRPVPKLPAFEQMSFHRESSNADTANRSVASIPQLATTSREDSDDNGDIPVTTNPVRGESNESIDSTSLIEKFVGRNSRDPAKRSVAVTDAEVGANSLSKDKQQLVNKLRMKDDEMRHESSKRIDISLKVRGSSVAVDDFNERIAEQQPEHGAKPILASDGEAEEASVRESEQEPPPLSSIVQNAFDRMRPRRNVPEVATITIGTKAMSSVISPSLRSRLSKDNASTSPSLPTKTDGAPNTSFSSSMRSFAAPGSNLVQSTGQQENVLRSVGSSRRDINSQPSREEGDSSASLSDGALESDNEVEDIRKSPEIGDSGSPLSNAGSQESYEDDEEKQAVEEARVTELIKQAEETSKMSSQDTRKRTHEVMKGIGLKSSIITLMQVIDASAERINEQLRLLNNVVRQSHEVDEVPAPESRLPSADTPPEEQLSLTVSKADFTTMRIVGQFNLGFILATRQNTDLFIIDQHASDEKCNFERLRATTTVQNQRLVQPYVLRLTAVEEEVILEHNEALLKNGFLIDMDTNGVTPVGERCRIISLPMSREVVFDLTDLEELIALLADSFGSTSSENIPRPSKVRRMFAMRACRSSIMVGKTLTLQQMRSLVRKMGEIDKPWNCPHGRPTMRHVCGLAAWDCWTEDDGLTGMEEEAEGVDWMNWVSSVNKRY